MKKFFVEEAGAQRRCNCGCETIIHKDEKVITFRKGSGAYAVSGNLSIVCAIKLIDLIDR